MEQDEHVHIRSATADDAGAVRAIYAPLVESSVVSFELVVPSEDEMAARITGRQPQFPWLVADNERGSVGYAYAGRFSGRPAYDWSVETSVYVADTARGLGVGRALYTALLALLTTQGYRRAMAGVALPNPASVRLHESAGFTPVGVYRAVGWKFGAWHDVGWWQRGLAPSDGAPEPPIPLDALPPGAVATALAAGDAVLT
jgi:L-amino acid N-acyltransferase YncA